MRSNGETAVPPPSKMSVGSCFFSIVNPAAYILRILITYKTYWRHGLVNVFFHIVFETGTSIFALKRTYLHATQITRPWY